MYNHHKIHSIAASKARRSLRLHRSGNDLRAELGGIKPLRLRDSA